MRRTTRILVVLVSTLVPLVAVLGLTSPQRGIIDWFVGRFQSTFESLEDGWVAADNPVPAVYGTHYVQLRLTDIAIADARSRFRERKAAFQSVVSVSIEDKTLHVPATVGPDSLAPLGEDEFLRLAQRNVALTSWLPFNSGNVEILCGLVSVPGKSDIEIATGFLGKLSDLVHVPQLSAAVTLATTVADGAAELLGGDEAHGVIGVNLGIGLGDLPDGYYLAIEPQAGQRPALETLGVVDYRLVDYGNTDHTGDPSLMDGWNYLLIEVRTTDTIGDAWREMRDLTTPLRLATDRVAAATTDKQLRDAKGAFLAAAQVAAYCPDLTARDRKNVISAMHADWDAAVALREQLGRDAEVAAVASASLVEELNVAEEVRELLAGVDGGQM